MLPRPSLRRPLRQKSLLWGPPLVMSSRPRAPASRSFRVAATFPAGASGEMSISRHFRTRHGTFCHPREESVPPMAQPRHMALALGRCQLPETTVCQQQSFTLNVKVFLRNE